MIRPLRARHRVLVFTLAALLPLLVWSALLARDADVEARALAPELGGPSSCLDAQWQDTDLWGGLAITTRIGYSLGDAGRAACELEAREPLKQPDLLLYWSPGAPEGSLPGDAFLLGAWGTSRRCFALPAAFGEQAGYLTLFSLGHGEVLASASLEH